MSARRVVLKCGAAETRAALLVDGEFAQIALAPARGDESLPRPLAHGDVVRGRIAAIEPSVMGAFVDLGSEGTGFLPLNASDRLVEGERRMMTVKRPALGAKGAVLTLSAPSAGLTPEGEALGRAGSAPDAAATALAMIGAAPEDAVHVDDPGAGPLVRARARNVAIAVRAEDADIGAAVVEALEREARLASGARLVFDEAEGLTVVDVDAAGAAAGATGRLADKVNAEAARRLFLELAKRGVGGRVVVDFLPPSDKDALAKLLGLLKLRARGVYPCRFGRLAPDGLFDLTAPRMRRSLLEELTEPAGDGFVRPGRRLTLDAAAKAAIGALEWRLARAGGARPRLFVAAEIGDYLTRARPQWRERLEKKFGARFSIASEARLKDRDHDLVD